MSTLTGFCGSGAARMAALQSRRLDGGSTAGPSAPTDVSSGPSLVGAEKWRRRVAAQSLDDLGGLVGSQT